jgi:hypothetical protein
MDRVWIGYGHEKGRRRIAPSFFNVSRETLKEGDSGVVNK